MDHINLSLTATKLNSKLRHFVQTYYRKKTFGGVFTHIFHKF